MKQKYILAACLCLFVLGGCGGSASSSNYGEYDTLTYSESGSGYGQNAMYDAKEEAVYDADVPAEEADPALFQEKLVYTGNLSIQTLKFDESLADLKSTISSAGGIIENETLSDNDYNWYVSGSSSSSGTRNAFMTVRIPSEKFQEFMTSADGIGKVISSSTNVENISRRYADNSVQIEALETQQERLLAMMDKAETIEDMIAVEQRLTEVQTQLNSLKTYQQSMDTDVKYSTVTINLSEVKEYTSTDESFLKRIGNAFLNGWKNFAHVLSDLAVLFLYIFPFLLLICGIVLCVMKIVGVYEKRKRGLK